MIGSMCSGALVLAALGLLDAARATTYPTARAELGAFGVTVVEEPFVANGNATTAAGCLRCQDLVGWVIERLLGPAGRDLVLRSIQPFGRGLELADADALGAVYAPTVAATPGP
jgi:transcriptional regulator GlxA family with amidase domain